MTTEQSPPTTLSEERLKELKELYSKATPGPWVPDDNEGFSQWSVWERMTPTGHGKPGRHILDIVGDDGQEENDAALVIALHNAFPSLLHAAEQMASTREEIQFLNWLLANCKIIHWPGGGHYPIEHAPAANKDCIPLLKAAMNKEGMYAAHLPPAPEKQEGGAAKPKNDAGWATCTSCGTYDWLVSHEPYPGICAKCAAKEGGAA